jgi:hypothetical protein
MRGDWRISLNIVMAEAMQGIAQSSATHDKRSSVRFEMRGAI